VNAFKTQTIRAKHKVSLNEEYVLGMVNQLQPIGTMRILNLAEKQEVMSPATTHKYLKQIERKKLIHKIKSEDGRVHEFKPTGKGIVFLEELRHAYR
jgi:DNA-binding MarR family transcriptional regulator